MPSPVIGEELGLYTNIGGRIDCSDNCATRELVFGASGTECRIAAFGRVGEVRTAVTMANKFFKTVIRDLGTDGNVGATQATHYYRTKIPRLGHLSELHFTIYNPGKGSNTFYVNEIRISGSDPAPLKASGIIIQKLAKFVYGREQGTSTAAANAQMLDKITPHTAQTVGANACYFNYRVCFGRFPGDTQYALNLAKFANDPVFEADIVIAGADLDAAPQMSLNAVFYTPDAPLAKYVRTIEIINEATGTGAKNFDLEQVGGVAYEGVMATFTVVTTADAGKHGIYADDGATPVCVGTFKETKVLNGSDFSFAFAEIEAIGTADTYAYYSLNKTPIEAMDYMNLVFHVERGATTTLTNISARQYRNNP